MARQSSSSRSPHLRVHSLEVRDLGKRYGRSRAIWGVDLDLHLGETLAVMGPNGSGKSTLVSLLGLLNDPSSGRISYLDLSRDPVEGKDLRGQMGLLTHLPMTYDLLSGRENMELTAVLYRVSCYPEKAARVLARVGLDPDDPRPCMKYSHGMRRRLALARALLIEPRILLLDEPLSGLDEKGQGLLMDLLEQERGNRLTIVATHRPDLAARLAFCLLILHGGSVVYKGEGSFSADEVTDIYNQALFSGVTPEGRR